MEARTKSAPAAARDALPIIRSADLNADLVEAAFRKVHTLAPRYRALLPNAGKNAEQIARLLGKTRGTIGVDFSGLYKRLGLSGLPNRTKRDVLLAIRSRLEECPKKETERAAEQPAALVQEIAEDDSTQIPERPLAVSDAEIALGARRIAVLPDDMQEVLKLIAEGLTNRQIQNRLSCTYGRVSESTSTIYLLLGLRRIIDSDDKRKAAAAMYRRSLLDSRSCIDEIRKESTAASDDRRRFEELEKFLNTLLDTAEAALKLIGGHRRA